MHGKLLLWSTNKAILFEYRMKGALMTVEIFALCGCRFLNQFDIGSRDNFWLR